jgi:hypothetical protein
MKITKRKLKQIIREELEAVINSKRITEIRGTSGPDVAAAQDDLDATLAGDAMGASSTPDREVSRLHPVLQGNSKFFNTELGSWTWDRNGLSMMKALEQLKRPYVNPAKILDYLNKNFKQNASEGKKDRYSPGDVWVRMAGEALGMKDRDGNRPWSERPNLEQKQERARQEARAKVDKLFASKLFSNAEPEDKKEAYDIILNAWMDLYKILDGDAYWSEEYMDDVFFDHQELRQRLAASAGVPVRKWASALAGWNSGFDDYEARLGLDQDKEVSTGPDPRDYF